MIGSETTYVLWTAGSDTVKKTGAGGGRVEDAEITVVTDKTRRTAQIRQFRDKEREVRWFRWFGQVQRRDAECIGRGMLRMELADRRRSMDVVKEDTRDVFVTEEDTQNRVRPEKIDVCLS